jgi:hypothetical protein
MTDSKPILPRSSPRLRTLKAARIVFNSDYSSYDVLIRDLSDTGVRLKLGSAFAVPDHFDLIIPNPNSGRKDRKACEKVWQRGDQAGARFLTVSAKPETTPLPEAPRLRRKPIGA